MGRVSGIAVIAVAVTAGTGAQVHADLVSLSATRDAAIYESFDGSLGNGAGRYLFAGKNNQNRARRSLVHFDVAGLLPTGATITSVRLQLNMSQGSGAASVVSLHRATSDWSTGASNPDDPEGSGTTALAGDATWVNHDLGMVGHVKIHGSPHHMILRRVEQDARACRSRMA